MMEEHAIVTGLVDGQATLEIERRTACGLCGQKRGCGNATWGKLLGHQSHSFSAENPIKANVGDSVVVGIDERVVLKSALLLYGVPLVGLLVGTVLADTFFKNEFYVILGAVTGLVLAFLWVKRSLNDHGSLDKGCDKQCQAVILRHADQMVDDENSVTEHRE